LYGFNDFRYCKITIQISQRQIFGAKVFPQSPLNTTDYQQVTGDKTTSFS
jgi:hypothetical protein